MTEFAAFLGVAVLIIVTPGPDTALTIQNTMLGGRAGGLLTAAGVATGQATWTLVTSFGLSALITAYQPLFIGLRLVGAVYLAFLGGRAIWTALHPRETATINGTGSVHPSHSPYAQGVLSNLSNPKMLVFFTSLLPQFADSLPGLVTLGLVFCAMTLCWLSAYSLLLSNIRPLLNRPLVNRMVEALTGSVLIGLGIRITAEIASS